IWAPEAARFDPIRYLRCVNNSLNVWAACLIAPYVRPVALPLMQPLSSLAKLDNLLLEHYL
ncbi:MAG: hypothetical protein AAGD25_38005, partial [Cyanobacteria bacterium P01_F01_bin.150]